MAHSARSGRLVAAIRAAGITRILVLLILGLTGAWFAFALAVTGLTRIKNPEAALLFIPGESSALAARADRLYFANPQKPPREVQKLALRALREQAINPKALRLLGYYADSQGDTARAEKFVRMAAKLSRREPGAQLWLIEFFARQNDTRQTLVHYDIALRTKPDTQTILFPRLMAALDDADIRLALKPYIRARDGWADDFLFFANANSVNLPAVVDLVIETGGLPNRETAQSQQLDLLSRLVNKKNFGDARRLYLQMPGANPERLVNASLYIDDRDSGAGSMGWQILDDPDVGGGFSVQSNEKLTTLAVFANSSTTRPVARKLLYLKSGGYSFSAKLASLDRGDGGFLRWQLRCASNESGQPVWEFDTISTAARAAFEIPADCPAQFLELIVSGGKGQTGLEATISRLAILSQS